MIISSYDPNDATGTCPFCQCGTVPLYINGMNLAFAPRHVTLTHEACGTTWRNYFETGKIEILEEVE